MVPTLNRACCGMAAPWGCGMPCSIMGNMLRPFFTSSDPEAGKPCANPAAMMGIPGMPPRRFCKATMESMLPIRPPFM